MKQHTVSQQGMLYALNWTGKHIYTGTVPEKVIARRRAKNKVARASRRHNRQQH